MAVGAPAWETVREQGQLSHPVTWQLPSMVSVIPTGKQHFLKDFILANGIDNRTYIMGLQEEMQGLEKEYKTLVIANTPPTPAPYEVRSGFATPVSTWI